MAYLPVYREKCTTLTLSENNLWFYKRKRENLAIRAYPQSGQLGDWGLSGDQYHFYTVFSTGTICNTVPVSDRGKRVQMIKMLCLTVLPILALWSYCVYQLTDIIATKTDNEKVTFHQNKFSPDVLNNNKYDCEIDSK